MSFSQINGQNFNSEVEGKIVLNDSKNEVLEITGSARNKTESNFSLRYELSVITSSSQTNNSSKNVQEGRFTLGPFESKNLSETVVNLEPEKRTIILLVIYDVDGKVVGTDRIVYDAGAEERAQKELDYNKPNEGIKLTGMVTDRTKTKPGKDFYNFFYQKYSLSSVKGNQIIEVEESISFGRATIIKVKIQNLTLFQFFAKPKLDFLKQMADEAFRRVNRYFQNLKNQKESIFQY